MHRIILLLAVVSVSHCFRGWDHNHDHGDWHHNHHEHGDWSDEDDDGPGHEHGPWPGHDHGPWPSHDHGPPPDHDHGPPPGHDHGPWPGHHGCHHNQGEESLNDHKFSKLSRYVIKADQYAKQFCKDHNKIEVQELYGNDSYQLIYTIPSSHVNNITMKIKNRVIYVNAKQVNIANPQTFANLRILPNILKIADAWWQYDEQHVTVTIPYSMTLGTATNTECNDVNSTAISVENVPYVLYRFATGQ